MVHRGRDFIRYMFILHKLKSHKRIKSNVPSNLATRIQVTYTMDFCVFLQTVFNQQVQIRKQYSVLIILCNLKIAALIRHHFTGQRSPFFFSLQVLLRISYADTCVDLPISWSGGSVPNPSFSFLHSITKKRKNTQWTCKAFATTEFIRERFACVQMMLVLDLLTVPGCFKNHS